MDIKTLMCARFVPPSYRKELLLKLQRLHQGSMCVSEYFKELESQMFRVGIKETNKEKNEKVCELSCERHTRPSRVV